MHLRYSIVALSYPTDLAATGPKGPLGPGPEPRCEEGGSRSISTRHIDMFFEHACLELKELYVELASCGAINERPCAYIVLHVCAATLFMKGHLGFRFFLRDPIPLRCHVRPGTSQEEDRDVC